MKTVNLTPDDLHTLTNVLLQANIVIPVLGPLCDFIPTDEQEQ